VRDFLRTEDKCNQKWNTKKEKGTSNIFVGTSAQLDICINDISDIMAKPGSSEHTHISYMGELVYGTQRFELRPISALENLPLEIFLQSISYLQAEAGVGLTVIYNNIPTLLCLKLCSTYVCRKIDFKHLSSSWSRQDIEAISYEADDASNRIIVLRKIHQPH
jgi:hypothetical protein